LSSTNVPHLELFIVETGADSEDEEEKTQERLAKRFTKRARIQRMEEMHADTEEFSQQRLIDEDETMKLELKKMKVSYFRSYFATILLVCRLIPRSSFFRMVSFENVVYPLLEAHSPLWIQVRTPCSNGKKAQEALVVLSSTRVTAFPLH
jgi:hypothetical protein